MGDKKICSCYDGSGVICKKHFYEIKTKKEMKYFLSVIEYGIMNNDWNGWKMGRIEVSVEGEHYPIYEGFIRLPTKAFDALREELDFKEFDKLPYLNFDCKPHKGGPK